MKTKRKRDWLDECFEYEATHPIAFAAPRALVAAHLIAETARLSAAKLWLADGHDRLASCYRIK